MKSILNVLILLVITFSSFNKAKADEVFAFDYMDANVITASLRRCILSGFDAAMFSNLNGHCEILIKAQGVAPYLLGVVSIEINALQISQFGGQVGDGDQLLQIPTDGTVHVRDLFGTFSRWLPGGSFSILAGPGTFSGSNSRGVELSVSVVKTVNFGFGINWSSIKMFPTSWMRLK